MSNRELEAQITQLTETWMVLIGPEHHKDSDCHFYIQRTWSYGKPPYWEVMHFGYWCDMQLKKKCDSYFDALNTLATYIEEQIERARKTIEAAD